MPIAELIVLTPGHIAIVLACSAVAAVPLVWWLSRREREPPEGPGGPNT